MESKRQLSRSLEDLVTQNEPESSYNDDRYASPQKQNNAAFVKGSQHAVWSLPRQPQSSSNLRSPLLKAHTMVFKDKEEETEQFSQSVPVKLVTSGRNREVAEMAPPLNLSRGLAECALCLEDFQDTGDRVPRNLACGHTFCTGCIRKLLYYPNHSRPEVDCSKCHTVTNVKDRRADTLPKNYGLLEILGTSSTFCCPPVSDKLEQEKKTTSPEEEIHYCREHGDRISSYCIEDNTLVCSSCLLYGEHKGHHSLFVNSAAEQEREKLMKLNPAVFRQRKEMETALAKVEARIVEVQQAGESVQDSIDVQLAQLSSIVSERRKTLMLEVMHRTQDRVQTLMDQATALRSNIAKTSLAYSFTARLVESNNLVLLEGCPTALAQVESVFTNPPPTLPNAAADLTSEFSTDVEEEIVSQINAYGRIKSVPGTVQNVYCDAYHDGFRVFWDGHNFTDNEGISYHLQVSTKNSDYVFLHRGGNTKYTWKTQLDKDTLYKFRVQVRTTEGIGLWSEPVTAYKAEPGFRWHHMWRNVHIELSKDHLEASCYKKSSGNHWATFAGNTLIDCGQLYFELEILDMGRLRPGKKRLALGVIACNKAKVNPAPWQDNKFCIGEWKDLCSWAFNPLVGTKNCHSFPVEGKDYAEVKADVGDKVGMLINVEEKAIHFFFNGQDLGVAFNSVHADALLPAVSIQDKVRVLLCFPPPPYSNRSQKTIRFTSLTSTQQLHKRK